jgi:hypothetical protein
MSAVNDIFNAESLVFCIIILDDPSYSSVIIKLVVTTKLLYSDMMTKSYATYLELSYSEDRARIMMVVMVHPTRNSG